MDADHSVELGPAAAALEIPWQDTEGRLHYVDLRAGDRRTATGSMERNVEINSESETEGNTERNLERIPEAQKYPALRRFLIELNSPRSVWQTAKCDVWSGEAEVAENLYGAGFSRGCYVDIVLAEQAAALRGSLEVHRQLAQEMAQRLEADDALQATAEIVVRRCYFHLYIGDVAEEESEAGYCLTLFLTGFGASAVEAANCWERAMEFAAECWVAIGPE